jgi:PIN domain nuclease of toxin-antitoxin system
VVADRERCTQEVQGQVKFLLDTNALIWWLQDDLKLGPRARRLISDENSEILVSMISLWEVTMKWRVGKMDFAGSSFLDDLADEQIFPLIITAEHLHALEGLGFHHKDPFDHLILAQAKVEGATIITSDGDMPRYGIPCLDCR